MDGINTRLHIAGEKKKINEFKELAIKVIQDEILTGGKERIAEKENNESHHWAAEYMKSTIILVNGIQENRGHKWGDKNVFGKNNGSKFSKLTETYKMQ